MGGLNKYFDGYDNDPIMWMDDPCTPDPHKLNEAAVTFKNVIGSTGPLQVEIKYGSMQFDSHLVIITSNLSPDRMANGFGTESCDAMYRRLQDPPQAIEMTSRQDCNRLKKYLIGVIRNIAEARLDLVIDNDAVYHALPRVSHIVFESFN